jgi:mRNA interferase RelE/StbE
MSCRVRLVPRARREFVALHKALRDRIGARIDALADDPCPPDSEHLTGKLRMYGRLRVGDYRVCYTVDDVTRRVTIAEIGHRGRAYDDLERRA